MFVRPRRSMRRLRKQKDFEVSIDFNCQSVVNPIADVSKFLPTAGNNYASFEDAELEQDLQPICLQHGELLKNRRS